MQVDTYLFGAIEVAPEKIIQFPQGLIAFESCKQFTLAHENDQETPASFTLQSLDDAALAFQIIDPTALGFHYELALTEAENTLLQSPAPEDVAVMLVLFKQDEGQAAISPNLRAPLVINTKARIGLQKVMEVLRPNITLSNLISKV
ncbi:MAG: flagellar assembly protein FliW [Azonexus sp.]|nr:flagellar assembly protein FliW [Azonexus sp.]